MHFFSHVHRSGLTMQIRRIVCVVLLSNLLQTTTCGTCHLRMMKQFDCVSFAVNRFLEPFTERACV